MNLAPYRKLIAYAVAACLLLISRYVGLDLGGTDDVWVELILLVAGGYGVYAAPNAPLPPPGPDA